VTNQINDSQHAARRNLTAVSDWLTGIIIEVRDELPSHRMKCRECGELLCVVDPNDSLWVLADVARDHRQFCRDKEERPHVETDAAQALANIANECRASAERECDQLRAALKEAIRMVHPSSTNSYTDDHKRAECERLTKAVNP
jgi:hypothetical protein